MLKFQLLFSMKYTIISLFLVTFTPMTAQLTGRLIDASTDGPVNNALIISGTSRSYSGTDGTFSAEPSGLISIFADGYHTVTIKADTLGSGTTGIVIPLHQLSYNLAEVSITAFNTPEKFRSVAGAVTIVPVDSLRYAGYNIVSSLSVSPGLIIQEATPGTMKLTLRGIGSRYPYGTKKIKMFFDGIPLYSAEGETYFDDINPEYLGRIEILRGPASSVYGASLGGAVVLYPVRPLYGHSELSLISSAGSYGYLKNTLTYSGSSGKGDLLVSLSGIRSDGYRENSRYRRKSILVSYNHRISGKLSGALLISGSMAEAQIPSSIDSATFVSNPEAAAPLWLETKGEKQPDRILAGYKLKYQPSGNLEISGSLFGTYRQNLENRPFNFLDESGASYGGRFLAKYARNSGKIDYRITGGTNLFFELYNNSIFENPGGNGVKGALLQKGSESIYQVDLFSQFDVYVSEFTFTGGFNLNKSGFRFTDQFSSDSVDQSGSSSFDPVLSPRISVSWNPVKSINSYIAINHGFTIPSLSETMTPLGLINTEIKPEKAWSYEAGIRFDLFRSRSFIDLALYSMKVSDLIVPKRVEEDFYIGMNAGASLHKGIEVSFQQWLWGKSENKERSASSAVMNLSYSLNRFRFLEFIEDENDFSGNQLPGIPENFVSGNLDLKLASGLYSLIEVLYSGTIPLDDFNSRYTDEWAVLNVRAGYSFALKKKWGIDAMFTINNITDTHYASMVVVNAPGTEARPPRYYYPGMPRWFTFTVALKYRFEKD
jgi:iron complex outermembrane receptor protein